MPSPITAHAATNSGRFGAAASAARPSASSTALAASTGRPPYRSIRWPMRGEAMPAATSPSETPPTTHGSGQPCRAATAGASTAGR